jgi:hypothetical protein
VYCSTQRTEGIKIDSQRCGTEGSAEEDVFNVEDFPDMLDLSSCHDFPENSVLRQLHAGTARILTIKALQPGLIQRNAS